MALRAEGGEAVLGTGTAPASEDALRARILAWQGKATALEPDARRREKLRREMIGSSERYLRSLDTRPVFEEGAASAFARRELALGGGGRTIERTLELFEDQMVRPGGHPAAAGHLAYFSGGGLYHAALADYLAAAHNKYAGLAFTGPGAVRTEHEVLRWVADLVGFPDTAGGSILSGGSLANLTAITAAREAHGLRAADTPSAVVYLSGETHHSVHKALKVAGLSECPVRSIPVDERFRMRPDALVEAIRADRRRDLTPWLIAATAGTTDTGSVDPLDELAAVAERESCWLHVDAAYGGFFLLTDRGRRAMRGIEHADSVVLDPHKSLFLPWGAGIVLVRRVDSLVAAFSETGHYLQDAVGADDLSPCDVSPELTKPFRALRIWLPLMHLGTEPFRAALEEKLLLARYFHREIAALGFEVGPPPDLSVVTFRRVPPGATPEKTDEVNRAILDGVRRDGRIFLSSTQLDGRFTLRLAALPHRTHLTTIDTALAVLRQQADQAERSVLDQPTNPDKEKSP